MLDWSSIDGLKYVTVSYLTSHGRCAELDSQCRNVTMVRQNLNALEATNGDILKLSTILILMQTGILYVQYTRVLKRS